MSDITLRVQGLEFRSHDGGEPRVLDIDIGKLVEMSRPRKVREAIQRHMESGFLSEKDCRPTVGRQVVPASGGFVDVTEYWLSKIGALKLITKLETPKAHEMVECIVTIFDMAISEMHKSQEMSAVHRMLMLKAGTWRRAFEKELTLEICKLYKHEWDGRGTQPVQMAGHWKRVYVTVYGLEFWKELKRRNPRPCKGSLHSQFFEPDARDLLDKDLSIVHAVARTSRTPEEFWNRLGYQYKREPLQLGFAGVP